MKLVKSTSNKVLSGVCAGLSQVLNIDVAIIRIIFAIGTIFSVGTGILIYIALALIMPTGKDDKPSRPSIPRSEKGGRRKSRRG